MWLDHIRTTSDVLCRVEPDGTLAFQHFGKSAVDHYKNESDQALVPQLENVSEW